MARTLYTLRVTIIQGLMSKQFARANPEVSRVIEIRGDQTLNQLHYAIFAAFDRWDDCHLSEFHLGGEPFERDGPRYVLPFILEDPDFDEPTPTGSTTRTRLGSLGLTVGRRFWYWYDFGDNWYHELEVLAVGEAAPDCHYPRVVARVGESPPQYLPLPDYPEYEDADEAPQAWQDAGLVGAGPSPGLLFDAYVGIDYSGAETSTSGLTGLQVYQAAGDRLPRRIAPFAEPQKAHWKWSRERVAAYLVDLVETGTRFLAGIDHCFSFPLSYFERYALLSWEEFLEDFVEHWPTHRPHVYVDFIRQDNPARVGSPEQLRLCERWTSSARSVFQFDVQGQVAKSSHAGLPWLWEIRRAVGDRVHFWPFDGWEIPDGKSVIAEVYPAVLRKRYPREDRTADEQDAYAVARWLKETCEGGFLERYLYPPLTERELLTAELEGWILGVT